MHIHKWKTINFRTGKIHSHMANKIAFCTIQLLNVRLTTVLFQKCPLYFYDIYFIVTHSAYFIVGNVTKIETKTTMLAVRVFKLQMQMQFKFAF